MCRQRSAIWYERYGQRASNYRFPQTETARMQFAATIEADGFPPLQAVYAADAPSWLAQLPTVEVLRRVWIQQFWRADDGQIRLRDKDNQPPNAQQIRSPYDVDARYAIKRGVGWCGYKAHFTETCEPDAPHLIVHVATTQATVVDVETILGIHADLAAADLLPDEHIVDAGYVSVEHILAARREHSVELTGPLPPDSGWQAQDPEAFDISRFTIDWDNRNVICPNGKTSRNWREALNRNRLLIIQATFRHGDCTGCGDRARCTRSAYNARNITLPPARAIPSTATDPRRAGHRRMAGTLRGTRWRRRTDGTSLRTRRHPPCPIPRPCQNGPTTRTHRDGHQPDPPRRLARGHPHDRNVELAFGETPNRTCRLIRRR